MPKGSADALTLKISGGQGLLDINNYPCARLLLLDVRPSSDVVGHTLHDFLSRPTPILCWLLQ
jgi:hypothetical protein